MKTFKFVLTITLPVFVGIIIVVVISRKNPNLMAEFRKMMMKMCEKMIASGKCPMDCCKKMMEKHSK